MEANNSSVAYNTSFGKDYQSINAKVESTVIVIFMVVTFLVALFGNTVVIGVISRVHSLQTATNLLLLNLSAADLVIATLNLPFKTVDKYITRYWPFGNAMCKLTAFSHIMVFFVSIFSLVAVAYERYTTICKPKLLRRFILTGSRVRYVVGVIWLSGILVASPMLKFFQTSPWFCPDGNGFCQYCASNGWTMDALKVYSVIIFFLFFVFPLYVMSFAYLSIGRTVWQSAQTTSAMRHNRDSERATKSRITKISLAMILSFVIAWGPGLSKRMYDFLSGSATKLGTETSRMLYILFHCFQYSNCAINPMLYSFMSDRFRQAFTQIYRRASRGNIKTSESSFSRRRSKHFTKRVSLSKDGQGSSSNKYSDDTLRTYNRSGSGSGASARNTTSQEQENANTYKSGIKDALIINYESAV